MNVYNERQIYALIVRASGENTLNRLMIRLLLSHFAQQRSIQPQSKNRYRSNAPQSPTISQQPTSINSRTATNNHRTHPMQVGQTAMRHRQHPM